MKLTISFVAGPKIHNKDNSRVKFNVEVVKQSGHRRRENNIII